MAYFCIAVEGDVKWFCVGGSVLVEEKGEYERDERINQPVFVTSVSLLKM
jgi:hypothetical protein